MLLLVELLLVLKILCCIVEKFHNIAVVFLPLWRRTALSQFHRC